MHDPYKKGFDMLLRDIQAHEARCVTPSRCEPFSTKLSAEGVTDCELAWINERITLAILAGREACANLCDIEATNCMEVDADAMPFLAMASAIRKRSNV